MFRDCTAFGRVLFCHDRNSETLCPKLARRGLVKLEDANFRPDGARRRLWALAMSGGRRLVYARDRNRPVVVKHNEHNLSELYSLTVTISELATAAKAAEAVEECRHARSVAAYSSAGRPADLLSAAKSPAPKPNPN